MYVAKNQQYYRGGAGQGLKVKRTTQPVHSLFQPVSSQCIGRAGRWEIRGKLLIVHRVQYTGFCAETLCRLWDSKSRCVKQMACRALLFQGVWGQNYFLSSYPRMNLVGLSTCVHCDIKFWGEILAGKWRSQYPPHPGLQIGNFIEL